MHWMLIIMASIGSGYAVDHIPMESAVTCLLAEDNMKKAARPYFQYYCLNTETGEVK